MLHQDGCAIIWHHLYFPNCNNIRVLQARRMGRIVKQYQDAIKMNKSGKAYAYEDLPAPPGFPPIPLPASALATGPGTGTHSPAQTPSGIKLNLFFYF